MISIYINDEGHQIDPTESLYDVLMKKKYLDQHIAIALNDQFVPRIAYTKIRLNSGDRIDVLVPMQGG